MTIDKVDKLTLYGEYNWKDPIYKVLRRETTSPRFKVYMMKKGRLNVLFFQFTDALAFSTRGGDDLDDLFRRQRRLLVDEGILPEKNIVMKNNFLSKKSPYEDLEINDFNHGPLWCG